jgi:23S rRNA pseudouridine2605 synthase
MSSESMYLAKFLAHAGACSRRQAADVVKAGEVTVNGNVVHKPATQVLPTDIVVWQGRRITLSAGYSYLLLNKPTGYLTTLKDPFGRPTIIDLIEGASTHRVFPVGRLDYMTSGLLLLTNDGTLAHKLAHPSHAIPKTYRVMLNRPLAPADVKFLTNGVRLHDGPMAVDKLTYPIHGKFDLVDVEIHSGRNLIVRRLFKELNYTVMSLDRIGYAGLTQQHLKLGQWRELTLVEVATLHSS